MLLEVVLARFAAEGVGPDVVFGLFVDTAAVDVVGAESHSFLFDAARFEPGSVVTSMGRGSGCCGAPDDSDSVGTEVAAVAARLAEVTGRLAEVTARLAEVTVSGVTRNGVLKSDSIGGCGCVSGAASSPCGS